MRFAFATFVLASSASTASAFTVSPGVANLPAAAQNTRMAPVGRAASAQQRRAFISTRSASIASSSPISLNLASGGGPEALQDYITSLSNTQSSLTKKLNNPKLIKLAGVAAIPLSYALGAAMTPSRRLAARAVGGVVAAVTAGGVGKNAVEEDIRRSCPTAIASRLLELGVDGEFVSDGIDRLKDDYGVDDEDFITMKTEVYAVYLVGMAKNPLAKTAELKELSNLREALTLDNMMVGQAHADAAVTFYRDVTRFTSVEELDDEDHPDRVSLDKMLFLSERAFRQGKETDEAFTFEFSRVAKALGGLSVNEALERAKDVARPFYERALASTRSKLESGAVNSDMLRRARVTLGLTDVEAKEMHIESFAKEIRSQLGLPEEEVVEDDDYNQNQNKRVETVAEIEQKMKAMKEEAENKKIADTSAIKFKDGAFDQLSKLQEVLGLTDDDADYEIAAATTEYWRNTALSTLEDAIAGTKDPVKAWSIIQSRQKELYLKDSSMKSMMTSMVIIDAIAAKETCKAVLKAAGWSEFEDFEKACFDPFDRASACGFLTNQDRHNMYNIFFQRSVKTSDDGVKSISDEAKARLKELRGMLGLSEEEGENQIRNFFGPELQSVLTTATNEILRGNTTDELLKNMKEKIDNVINNFQLDEEMVRSYAGPLYNRAVEQIAANTPGGIPNKDQVATLASLRELLGIAMEDVYEVHVNTFGESYKKGIKEALGTTGVIREEFRAPLEDLRSRLGVSDKAAKDIYLEALGERMKPMVEYISNEMERLVLSNDQLAQKRGADYGEDYFKSGQRPSVSVFGSEICHSVIFMNIFSH
jgi:hypothetical protein